MFFIDPSQFAMPLYQNDEADEEEDCEDCEDYDICDNGNHLRLGRLQSTR